MNTRLLLRYTAAFLVLATLPLCSYALDPEAPGVFVRIVDVGAGHCAIVKFTKENGWTDYMLYDAGNWKHGGSHAYNNVRGIFHKHNVIQLFVLSHTDSDHIAAVKKIADDYKIQRFLRTGWIRTKPPKVPGTWKSAIKAVGKEVSDDGARDINQKVSGDAHGTTYAIGDATVTLLSGFGAPPSDWSVSGKSKKRNSISIVVRLDYAGRSILFTGDAVGKTDKSDGSTAIATEKYLLDHASERPLNADVLIAAHHGANNASSTPFIEAVSPTYVIFPAGSVNGHPRIKTVNRFKKVESVKEIFRTDLGDNEDKGTEWSWGRTPAGDDSGDDHVDIYISPDGDITVEYASPSSLRRPYLVKH